MNKTKIDWCDMTWNPVSGCLNDCPYCYARSIAKRFAGGGHDIDGYNFRDEREVLVDIDLYEPEYHYCSDKGKYIKAAYPAGFTPTFHRYRLEEPQKAKKPQTIFVCSMGDLFAKNISDEWIDTVLEACSRAPQHRYLFLTKNPIRYLELANKGLLPSDDNFWYGTSITTDEEPFWWGRNYNTFLSIEPIMGAFEQLDNLIENGSSNLNIKWNIVGAETGNRKGKVIPEREWIENILAKSRKNNIPVFMKESLRELMGTEFVQEFPWR